MITMLSLFLPKQNLIKLLIIYAALLCSCVERNPVTSTPLGDSSTQIVFTSQRDGNEEIYVMNTDGSQQARLTNNQVQDGGATWSPDGTHVVFYSYRDGNWEVYVMKADGSEQTNLTQNDANDMIANWSPDGKHIAFMSNRRGTFDIFVINSDGSGNKLIADTGLDDYEPVWSPNGEYLAFSSGDSGEIYTVKADGTELQWITKNGKSYGRGIWAPDSQHIAYSNRDGKFEIYVVNRDGSGTIQLTHRGTPSYPIEWSENEQIYFYTDASQTGFRNLYVMNSDGTDENFLVSLQTNRNLELSPDHRKIAYVLITPDSNGQIYVTNINGSEKVQMTNGSMPNYHPRWQP